MLCWVHGIAEKPANEATLKLTQLYEVQNTFFSLIANITANCFKIFIVHHFMLVTNPNDKQKKIVTLGLALMSQGKKSIDHTLKRKMLNIKVFLVFPRC